MFGWSFRARRIFPLFVLLVLGNTGAATAQVSGEVPGPVVPAALIGPLADLRSADVAVLSANELVRLERLFRNAVERRSPVAQAWYGLGVVRTLMGRAGLIAKEGPLQPAGVSLEAGAGNALVRALQLDSTFQLAAEALALVPLPREGKSQLGSRLEMLRQVRARSTPLSPTAWAMMGIVEREAGDPDSATAVLREALAHGADTAFAAFELARVLERRSAIAPATDALLLGAAHISPGPGKERFDQMIRWAGSPEEVEQWRLLPADHRSEWLRRFWEEHDVRSGRSAGEALAEHFRRMDFALQEYRVELPRVGRSIGLTTATGLPGHTGDRPLETSEEASWSAQAVLLGHESPFRTFLAPDDLLDDRGVIFVRHGAPAAIARTHGSADLTGARKDAGEDLELWRYDLPDGPRFFSFKSVDFDGSASATVLVPTLAASQDREQLCAVDQRLCLINPKRIPLDLVPLREEGLRSIAIGTTTDDHTRQFFQPLNPLVQMYGLRSADGTPRIVAAFAVPGDQLAHEEPPEAGGRSVYSLRAQLLAYGPDGVRREVDTTRRFAVLRPLVRGEYLSGVVDLSVASGTQIASLVLTQEDGRGAVAHETQLRVPGEAFAISDMVLGREGSGVSWNSGSGSIPLNPLNAFEAGSTADLYFQLGGVAAGDAYQTRLEVLGAKEGDKPRISLVFHNVASKPRQDVALKVGLTNLEPGRYRLRVTVASTRGSTSATSWLTIGGR